MSLAMRTRKICLTAGLLILCSLNKEVLPAYAKTAAGIEAGSARLLEAGRIRRQEERTARLEAAETGTIEFPYEESSATAESELKGKIQVDLISVELPVGGFEFNIDTTEPFTPQAPGAQIQSPAIHVANHSVVPVKVEISQVAEVGKGDVSFTPRYGEGPAQEFQLVDRITGVNGPGKAILVLGVSQEGYKSETDFEQHAILPGRKDIYVTRLEAWESKELSLYGKVTPDFYGEYQFTVKPTLKISTVQAAD